MELVHASLSARKGIENSSHNSGAPVKLMHACCRMNTESSFHHCGSLTKLVKASLWVRNDVGNIFHHSRRRAELVPPVWASREIQRVIFTIVEIL